MAVDLTKKPVAAIAPFGLRMQPDLKAQIEAAAEANKRSMNAEIVARLESSLDYQARIAKNLYVGDRPLELGDSFFDDIAEALERARIKHNEKYGETPPERRKPAKFPLRVDDTPPPVESLTESQLREGLDLLRKETERLEAEARRRSQKDG